MKKNYLFFILILVFIFISNLKAADNSIINIQDDDFFIGKTEAPVTIKFLPFKSLIFLNFQYR